MTHAAHTAPEGAGGDFEIVIAEDGRVIFRTASTDMLEIARSLAPEAPQLRRGTEERETDESRATGRD